MPDFARSIRWRITGAGVRGICPGGLGMPAFEYKQAEEFPDTTQDTDLFVDRSLENGRALVEALRELDFDLTAEEAAEIVRGKDFIQLKNGPFDLDLVFAPDGIEQFEDAWKRHVDVQDFPVCHIDDIIASKQAANRERDREALPRLRAFRDYWMQKRKQDQ